MNEIPHEKPLKRIKTPGLYHVVDWVKVPGPNQKMHGDCSGLRGDCSGLSGDCSGLSGDCTGLSGYCTGFEGDLSAIPHNLRLQHPCLEHWINTEENE